LRIERKDVPYETRGAFARNFVSNEIS
jgi:hypothetical protein